MSGKLKGFLLLLLVLGLVGVVYFGGLVSQDAALSVTSDPSGQKVYLDEVEVGETPYFSDTLKESNPDLRFGGFNQKIKLTAGALTVVNWVSGPLDVFSGGEVVWFSPSSTGTELLVISQPGGQVYLNGELLGESPLSKPLAEAEYELEIKKEGYFPRKLKVAVKAGFRLNVSAQLPLNPFPDQKKALSSPHSSLKVWSLANGHPPPFDPYPSWVRGVIFWSERDEDETTYHFYLAGDGKLYDGEGSELSVSSLAKTTETRNLAYLGNSNTLTSAASRTLTSLATRLYPVPVQVEILETGLGYLRVRSGPGTSYSQIGQAPTGSKYTYLGEQGDWFKISFEGKEGWVSKDYSRKL